VLGSAFVIERELGGGGMSRVFVGLETALGRRVVIKVLPPELAAGISLDRFRREIQVAAQLQHPHIVPVLSTGEADGLLYYAMPFVQGESLGARLARGALPVETGSRILHDIVRAIAYAHATVGADLADVGGVVDVAVCDHAGARVLKGDET